MESKQILLSRKSILKEWRNKEWWYTGFYDSDLNIYFSFFIVRVNAMDQLNFTLFDPKKVKPLHFSKNLILDKSKNTNDLDLSFNSKDTHFSYKGSELIGWNFNFKNKNFQINLSSKATIPPFKKFDVMGANRYALLHYFNNEINGFIQTPEQQYSIKKALSYYDHCFGTVPRKTSWHWLAVQNKTFSLASLVNYGINPQRYTECYCTEKNQSPLWEQWIRLNQEVSFEYNFTKESTGQIWKVTSPDLDLNVYPIQHITIKTSIPPLLPFLVSLRHTEFFVKVNGRIRIENQWIETNDMFGVMEDHHGKW